MYFYIFELPDHETHQRGGSFFHSVLCSCAAVAPAGNTNIRIEDVRLFGINVNVNELVGLSNPGGGPQTDSVGALYQYEANLDENGRFSGNPISNAQLFVSKHMSCIAADTSDITGPPCQRQTAPLGSPCMRSLGGDDTRLHAFANAITQETLDWAARGGPFEFLSTPGSAKPLCGGDVMFHVNKVCVQQFCPH